MPQPTHSTVACVKSPTTSSSATGSSFGGPLTIPHLFNGGTRTSFFLNYSGNHSRTPVDSVLDGPDAGGAVRRFLRRERGRDRSAHRSTVPRQPPSAIAHRSGGADAPRVHPEAQHPRRHAELPLRHGELVEQQRREPSRHAHLRGRSRSAAAGAAAAGSRRAVAVAGLAVPAGSAPEVRAAARAAGRSRRAACSTPASATASRRLRARPRFRPSADPRAPPGGMSP